MHGKRAWNTRHLEGIAVQGGAMRGVLVVFPHDERLTAGRDAVELQIIELPRELRAETKDVIPHRLTARLGDIGLFVTRWRQGTPHGLESGDGPQSLFVLRESGPDEREIIGTEFMLGGEVGQGGA